MAKNPFAWYKRITKTQRIGGVIVIATAFLLLELAVGFITRSLVLVADAFHILSDIIGYIVAFLAVRYASPGKVQGGVQYTYGYQRAEVLGAFFNGAFLSALGVSILLQSIERFIEPSDITDPVLVMAVGAAGIGSNILMLLILGGHSHGGHSHGGHSHGHSHGAHKHDHGHDHSHAHGTAESHGHELQEAHAAEHAGHAHVRITEQQKKPSRFADLNILGVLVHVLGDALNSVAVIISGGIYMATGFKYADPIASVFVGAMIIGTAWPLLVRSGRSLLDAAPDAIDIKGVKEDIERVSGEGTVHDLHVWSVDSKNAIASMHLYHPTDSLKDYDTLAEEIRKCLHLWGIHSVTIQPEIALPTVDYARAPTDTDSTAPDDMLPDPQVVLAGAIPGTGGSRAEAALCRRQCTDSCQAPVS